MDHGRPGVLLAEATDRIAFAERPQVLGVHVELRRADPMYEQEAERT